VQGFLQHVDEMMMKGVAKGNKWIDFYGRPVQGFLQHVDEMMMQCGKRQLVD
jgi:hypothetical protein